MKSNRWSAGVLILLVVLPEAPAQVGGLGVTYRRNTKNSSLTLSYRRPYGYFYGPIPQPYGFTGYTKIVVVQPPIFVQPPPLVQFLPPVLPPLEEIELEPQPMPRPREEVPEVAPLPGRDAGVFKPLDADNRDRARRPVAPPKEEPKRERIPPPPPPMKADPAEESVRQLDLGREAFARGEYGRAAERFLQAIELAPTNPLGHFLLAQAHTALGNNRRAFDALLIGLRLDPTWPRQSFQPSLLYGDNVIDHAEHLRLLEELQMNNPADPVLLFVTGYQLWFDGRREEGRVLLQRVAPVLPDPTVIDRFLQALPNREVF